MLFLIALSIQIVRAEDDMWFYRSSYLILEPLITTSFDIISPPNQRIDYIIANISFFPRQTNTQGIITSEYMPAPKISDDALTFRWDNPKIERKNIQIKNRIKTINDPAKIRGKIDFPLKEGSIPQEYVLYTKPSEIIDLNSRIISLASDLASGEDDMFMVVDKIAVWVNINIKYNLSTVNVEAAEKASWVMEHREGVCDELTSLFISMLRSLGIPARFISGISYTNLDMFENKWGAHGWAEVYFPGYGWVPFDVTYGEYGWVDPTHIVSKAAEDAGKFTSQYTWRSENGVVLKTGDLKTDVNIIEKGPPKKYDFSISASVLEDQVGFGSYNLVIADVKNLADYYQSFDVFVSYTTRLSFLDSNKKHVVLKPYEEKNVYWIMRTDETLDRDYMYTFPVVIYTLENITSKASFVAVDNAKSYSLEFINSTLMQNKVEDNLVYSRKVMLNCSTGKKEYYDYEKPEIGCYMKNTGNVFLKDMQMCLKDECQNINLGITEGKQASFKVHEKKIGENGLKVILKNDDISKVSLVDFTVLDRPQIDIDDIEYPANATYGWDYYLKFRLKKKSISSPQNIDVTVKINRAQKKFHFDSLDEDKIMEVNFRGKDLSIGENSISVLIDYEDKNGKKYPLNVNFVIELVNATLFQKFMILMRTII